MAVLETSHAYSFADTVTLDVTSVPAGNVQTETYTVKGIRPQRPTYVEKVSQSAGLFRLDAYGSNENELTIVWFNPTGSAIDPASGTFWVVQF